MSFLLLMFFILSSLIIYGSAFLFTFPGNKIPVVKRETTDFTELRRLMKLFETNEVEDVIRFLDEDEISHDNEIKRLSFNNGQSCGFSDNLILVHNAEIADTFFVAGEKMTVAADVDVKREVEHLSLISVIIKKVGAPKPVPCVGGMWGSCNFTNPCAAIQSMKCPEKILPAGWNCRCPFSVHQYTFPSTTYVLPRNFSVPGWLEEGKYHMEVRMFEGINEVMCYRAQMQVTQGK